MFPHWRVNAHSGACKSLIDYWSQGRAKQMQPNI